MKISRTKFSNGAIVGLAVTIALTTVFFFAHRLFGWPMIPFDFFDWLARTLPGGVVGAGIEVLVKVLTAVGLSVRETAKTAQGAMALGIFLMIGAAAGAGFALVAPEQKPGDGTERESVAGWALGALFALIMLVISVSVSEGGLGAFSVLWVAAAYLGWGLMIARGYGRLHRAPMPTETESAASVEQISRRQFLVTMGKTTAIITVVGTGVGLLIPDRTTRRTASGTSTTGGSASGGGFPLDQLPNKDAAVQPVPGTRPEYTPLDEHYRIDINLAPVSIDGATWTLPIHGLVDNPLNLTIADLYAYESMSQFVTLACISNELGGDLIGTTRWTGVSMQKLLADSQVKPNGKFMVITGQDGFFETLDLAMVAEDERIMLCYEWDDQPLQVKHGFPARIYIPDRYGMKQPKWIVDMEVIDADTPGYWIVRGWDKVARMQTTSVIDTVAVDAIFEENGRQFLPIGGIAHAGARGISKVEVRVDDGEWTECVLREPISGTTWVIWRYDWAYAVGQHQFSVRATDGNGDLQITTSAPTHPSGATGVYSVQENV